MATPEDVKAQETEITAGKELTLTGKNMDMIAAVLFPGVEKRWSLLLYLKRK